MNLQIPLAFADTARKENKLGYVIFADKLILHARTEEEIIYPMTILIGEYVKLRLGLTG